jgi:hypothetical protein
MIGLVNGFSIKKSERSELNRPTENDILFSQYFIFTLKKNNFVFYYLIRRSYS